MYKRTVFSIGGSIAINIPADCYNQLAWNPSTQLFLRPLNTNTLLITTQNSTHFWADLKNACHKATKKRVPRG